jgi:hypothetical protein
MFVGARGAAAPLDAITAAAFIEDATNYSIFGRR